MLVPCEVSSCPHSRPCPDHGHLLPARYAHTSLKPTGSTRLWRRRRGFHLARHPLCVECAARGIATLATEVGHIKPRSEGGTDSEANLASLCHAHHRHSD